MKKETINQAAEVLTSLIIGFLAAALFLVLVAGCGGYKPLRVVVAEGLPDRHHIKAEVREAVAFYAEARGMDYLELTDSLTVYVVGPDPWDYKGTTVAGLYTHVWNEIQIAWLGGVTYNALFHELVHRECHLLPEVYDATVDGDKDHADHTAKFTEIWLLVRETWKEAKDETP